MDDIRIFFPIQLGEKKNRFVTFKLWSCTASPPQFTVYPFNFPFSKLPVLVKQDVLLVSFFDEDFDHRLKSAFANSVGDLVIRHFKVLQKCLSSSISLVARHDWNAFHETILSQCFDSKITETLQISNLKKWTDSLPIQRSTWDLLYLSERKGSSTKSSTTGRHGLKSISVSISTPISSKARSLRQSWRHGRVLLKVSD